MLCLGHEHRYFLLPSGWRHVPAAGLLGERVGGPMIEPIPDAETISQWRGQLLEEMALNLDAEIRGVTRLLLRPQHAGRIHRTVHNGWGNPNPPNYPGYGWYPTRAQAAQAAARQEEELALCRYRGWHLTEECACRD